jgi:Phosphate-selective porin O and P
MNRNRALALPFKLLVAANLAMLVSGAFAQTPSEQELIRKVDQLADELTKVKDQLKQMQEERAATPAPAAAPAAVAAPLPATSAPATASAREPGSVTIAPSEPATVLFSYGEINYNRPTKHTEDTEVDVRRFVLGFQHRFDEKNKVVTELEVEHAVSSADDPGEVEVEQAYVEHMLNPKWSVRGGLFLIPAGLLNEKHEPTAYYGVERNFVETAIIPTTWREAGAEFIGNFDNGLTLQTGLGTGFNLNKWDAASTEGAESPLGSIHQEAALAKGHDLSVFAALNWRGIPGLQLGGSIFTGEATQGQATTDSRVTLWDLHARWTPGLWDLSALYARGTISNTAALNTPLVGNPTLIPESFDGWYTQAAYRVWSRGDYALTPFVRWEQFNTARSFADIGAGFTPEPGVTERVITVGANFQVTPGIVLKADVQRFREVEDNNRFDLGLGWSF